MNKKSILTLVAAVMVGSAASAAEKYHVTVPATPEMQGLTLYMLNYDTTDPIDSVEVNGEKVDFIGEIDESIPAALGFKGSRPFLQFVLEGGSMVWRQSDNIMVGTMLNDRANELDKQLLELSNQYKEASGNEALQQSIYEQYGKVIASAIKENADNPLGYFYFLNGQYDMSPGELLAVIDANPTLAAYKRVEKIKSGLVNKQATQEGSMFRDFEVTYNGKTERLSDYVGKGKYVLVDYWASWCGPCIRQTVVLKDLYQQYKDKGLEVLGVAVWDDPDDTIEAIKKHDLPWHSIINAQTIPTDLYGISGIPCIILYGPDGTILSRDKQDDALRNDVAKYLGESTK